MSSKRSFLDQESSFMGFMNRASDIVLVNILFFFTSLPIFTVGASTAAMYTVLFRMGTDRETSVVKPFFEAFRQNFKKATAIWLLLLVMLAATCFNCLFFLSLRNGAHYIWVLCVFLLVFLTAVCSYALPLQSQFENTVSATLRNAVILTLGYLPRSILMAIIHLLPAVLYLCNPYAFFRSTALLILMYFGVSAYLCTKILRKVFDPLREKSMQEEPK